MKKNLSILIVLIVFIAVFCFFATPDTGRVSWKNLNNIFAVEIAQADVYVKGYYKSNGTYVEPHYRSNPDSNPYNNWSYPGNTNPYTGKVAPGNPSTYLDNYYNNTPSYKLPSLPSYTLPSLPSLPSYKLPSYDLPSYTPSLPSYTPTLLPSYKLPSLPSYESPSTPSYSGSYLDSILNLSSICPLNSTYSYLHSICECKTGMFMSGNQCVSQEVMCKKQFGDKAIVGSTTNNCKCSLGYMFNSISDSCIPIPIKTNYQICQESFGTNSSWNGTKTNDGLLNCICKTGYTWNSAGNACVIEPSKINSFGQTNLLNSNLELNNSSTQTAIKQIKITITQKKNSIVAIWKPAIKNTIQSYYFSSELYRVPEQIEDSKYKIVTKSKIVFKRTTGRKGKLYYLYLKTTYKTDPNISSIATSEIRF